MFPHIFTKKQKEQMLQWSIPSQDFHAVFAFIRQILNKVIKFGLSSAAIIFDEGQAC